jgi:mRNA-degrading endonuclease toxin of MazEF toxin-antitoxin module
VRCRFDGKDGHVVADRLRALDRERPVRRLGSLSETTLSELMAVLQAIVAMEGPG